MPDKAATVDIPTPNDPAYFDIGNDPSNLNWGRFKTTADVPADRTILNQIVGQEECLEDLELNFQKFLRKVTKQNTDFLVFWEKTKRLVLNWNYYYTEGEGSQNKKTSRWWASLTVAEKIYKAQQHLRDNAKKNPQSNADRDRLNNVGVYCLLVGPPGTGKSLIAKGYRERLEQAKIQPPDVLLLANPLDENRPRELVVPGGFGQELLDQSEHQRRYQKWLREKMFKVFTIFAVVLGILMIIYGLYLLVNGMLFFGFILTAFGLMVMIGVPSAAYFFKSMSGRPDWDPPVIVIDSRDKKPRFIDASGQSGAALLGDIKWDALQTRAAGGEPPHTRAKAGAIHRAHQGVLFYDEMNQISEEDIPDLLTVLEEGMYPITSRSKGRTSTSALNVATEPLPCTFFFMGCGNEDALQRMHPALRQRFQGYGSDVWMTNYVANTAANRRRIVKFIVNETDRLGLLPFSREAAIEVVEECRRRAVFRNKLTVQLRPILAVLSKASEWARLKGRSVVTLTDVAKGIDKAISVELQKLKQTSEVRNLFKHLYNKGSLQGVVNGLAVNTTSAGEEVGHVLPIRVMAFKVKDESGSIKFTGQLQAMAKESVEKVATVLFQKHKLNPKDWIIHIDFSQTHGLDGPSAGVAMAVALSSILLKKYVRQNIAMTGEILIDQSGKIEVGPIGGVAAKIRGAEMFGLDTVLVPYENYQASVTKTDFKAIIIPIRTLDEALSIMLTDKEEEAQRATI
jgi:Lon-like ATP-dependent protease